MPTLTPDQINKLKSLGIQVNEEKNSPFVKWESGVAEGDLNSRDNQAILSINLTTPPTTNNSLLLDTSIAKKSNVFPLLSISGLTLLSLSGLILFKSNSNKYGQTDVSAPQSNTTLPKTSVSPTQVPKSIQHYLLTSQQFFTQASQNQSVDALNQSIVAATEAIKEFPNDYRGYYQRGRIYQSVAASQPQVVTQVITDLSQAQKLNPNDAEITRSLASAYAIKGDAQNTINYLSQTIALEPTKAQNFYDLAKIQQQIGLLPQAVETYDKLLTILSDPTQKTQVESEKSTLQKLISQNPQAADSSKNTLSSPKIQDLPSNISLDSPTIQASAGSGLIVAAPEKLDQIEVSNLAASNSLSGTGSLPSGQKEITITNSQVTDNSQIYVSIISGGKNQNLQVLSKSEGSFIVGLDSPINETIEFKWWIIN